MADKPASEQIDNIIKIHGGWKADILSELRTVILQTDPGIFEEVKWKMPSRPEGLPVWSNNGIVCYAEIWKDNVKLMFAKGSQLEDPAELFNARLKSSSVRAIEFHEDDTIDRTALKELVLEAVAINH